jgi:hypothetical protein
MGRHLDDAIAPVSKVCIGVDLLMQVVGNPTHGESNVSF